MHTSVLFPVMPTDPTELIPFAKLVSEGGMTRLWQGQSLTLETHQMFAYLAGAGLRVPVGTSVTLMPLRHPVEAAAHARSLARLTGAPVVLGIGPGSPDFAAALRGDPYRSPRAACADYLAQLRACLGSLQDTGTETPSFLLPELVNPGVELGLGVLRPALAQIAGEAADAAISWMTPAPYISSHLRPALNAGAERAARPVPRLVTVVHVAVSRPGRNPHQLAYAAARAHLSASHYTDMLRQAGLRVHPSQPLLNARALVESGTFIYGTPQEVESALATYQEAGVDEVVLNSAGVGLTHGWDAAVKDLRDLVATLPTTPDAGRSKPVPERRTTRKRTCLIQADIEEDQSDRQRTTVAGGESDVAAQPGRGRA